METIVCNLWYLLDGKKYCPYYDNHRCTLWISNMIECGMFKEDNKEKENKSPMMGWICPRCGKVNSPFIPECDCPPPIKITTDSGSYNSLDRLCITTV